MKKSLWIVLLLALVCTLALSACDDTNQPQTPNEDHVHAFGEWTTVKDATCTVKGEQERTCSCGEKETKSIDATGHTEVIDASVAATCTTDGKTEGKHCSVCNETIIAQNTIPASHTDGEWITDTDATCTVDGSKHQVCSVCTATIKTEPIAATGHTHGEWVTDTNATCTVDGRKHQVCSVCTATIKTEPIAATGHTDGEWVTDTDATCTVDGSKHQVCSVCSASTRTGTIAATGHTESDFVIDVPATIYTDGSQHTYCTTCNEDVQTNVPVPRITSNGLAYEVNADGTTCTITGIGTCIDTEIGIPDTIDGYKVIAIGENAFENQITITSIALSNNVETISNRAFYGCTGLNEFTITKNVRTFGTQIFYKANNLKTIYYYSSYSSNVSPFASSSVEHVVLVDVTSLPNIFSGSSVKKVTIPDSVRYIGTQFSGLTSLTDITIGKGVSSIDDEAFTGCVNLENVYYNGTIADWCSISLFYRSYGGTIEYRTEANPMYYAKHFYIDGEEIKEIIIPEGQTNINKFAFYGFDNITKITLPSSIQTIGSYAFSNCNSLENVYYCGTISDWCSISFGNEASNGGNLSSNPMYYAQHFFIDETELKELVIPDTVSVISDRAFCGFENITTVIIPDSITAIGKEVFYHCDNLLSIVMPKSIGVIEASAFSYCKNIDYVYYEGTEDDWSLIGIGSSNSYLQNAIHYYSENQPTSEDNYWHYVDGVPTPW